MRYGQENSDRRPFIACVCLLTHQAAKHRASVDCQFGFHQEIEQLSVGTLVAIRLDEHIRDRSLNGWLGEGEGL